MINIDQIQLLEAKIESAVEKISQLQVENDALRNRVQELSNALSAKSEQLSNCEQKLIDSEKSQELIENGILKALNRLNSIENNVLKSNSVESTSVTEPVQPVVVVQEPVQVPVQPEPEPVFEPVNEPETEEVVPAGTENFDVVAEESETVPEMPEIEIPVETANVEPSAEFQENPFSTFDANKSDIPGFDIF